MKMPVVLSVTQINTYVKSLLDGDINLNSVFVSGEISNFTNHYKSGHLYFSLKDQKCVIKAVMFAQYANRLRFLPENGMRVIVRGRVSLYEQTGQYQFYIEDIQPDGIGALHLAYEQLKNKLEAERLFAQERKKTLPEYPTHIGVITSPTGAAVHDIITVLNRRWPLAKIVFCPALVQGEGAAPQLVSSLQRMNHLCCADLIIIGRGGGSIEDLWPFNEEPLARAVAASEIPVVSAVGHETDYTICDFAADLRAPTPSAAAELSVPDCSEVLADIYYRNMRMRQIMKSHLITLRKKVDELSSARVLQAPSEGLAIKRMIIDDLEVRLLSSTKSRYTAGASHLSGLCGKLHALSPLAVLSRGYAIAYREDTQAILKVEQVSPSEKIVVRVSNGILKCTIDATTKAKEDERG